jgi:multiple sugar transport system substrate-binding protein
MTNITRRHLLGMAGGLAAAGSLGGLASCSSGTKPAGAASTGSSATGSIRLGWWGNDLRNAQTKQAAELFQSKHAGTSISLEPDAFSAYFDKLATQTAGGKSPDMIQMADGYIGKYGSMGALLDLSQLVDVSKFTPGTVDTGRIGGKLVGVNAGINAPLIIVNKTLLAKAKISVPDDKTWTWDDYRKISSQFSAASGGTSFGTVNPFGEGPLRAWLRQHGQELFTTEGKFGGTMETLQSYFQMVQDFANDKAMPGAAVNVEEATKPLEQSSLVLGKAAFGLYWSNQVSAIAKGIKDEIALLRMPSTTGRPQDLKAWYHPSMMWSASAKTKNPALVAEVINFWVNSMDSASICLDERGFPANAEIAVQIQPKLSDASKMVAKFLEDLRPVLGDPQPVPPSGAGTVLGDILTRVQQSVMFGKNTPAAAATQFMTESKAAITA